MRQTYDLFIQQCDNTLLSRTPKDMAIAEEKALLEAKDKIWIQVICMYVHVCMYVCMYVCMCEYICMCICICICIYVYIYIYIYIINIHI